MESNLNTKSKFPNIGTTIFTVMSQLAAENNALNLSQGFPDFKVSEELISLVEKYMRLGYNQYAPMAGDISLRESISEKIERMYSLKYNVDSEITITAGATQAIFTAICSIISERDEAIVFTPAYDCYAQPIEMLGGKINYVKLNYPDYTIDWDAVKKFLNRRTKLIIINTPHNPTGSIMSAYDLQMLQKLTKDSEIVILSDEVYEHQIFDGYEHQSVARFPELAKRSFIVYSFGKTFHVTGWKLGFCVAPEKLMAEFRKVHQYNVFACNHPMQKAMADFLANSQNYINVAPMYQEKRDYFLQLIKGSRFKFRPAAGSYFQLLNYEDISDLPDTEFAIHLTQKHKVAAIPVSVFYNLPTDNKVLRFCFAKENETLEKAAEILCKI